MNPPSALYGAMNKERKPFTYTPGGLDLSEIKSERMAKRLMRNAMSEGVPETPVHKIQSPPIATGIISNFNCLPVQVFPTFQLPANPKSLLRTRSNIDAPRDSPSNNIPLVSTSSINKHSSDSWKEINKPSSEQFNNNISSNYKTSSIYDYKPTTESSCILQPHYESCGHTDLLLPEKRYNAKYFQLEPQESITSKESILQYRNSDVYSDVSKNPPDNQTKTEHLKATQLQDIASNNYEQKEVKVVKTQTKTGNEKDQNGDTEAEVIVKLPAKTSAAKTETKVEISKKILPDGTVEEVKKTITKTTVDGKTEISTKTETRTIPKEIAEDIDEIEAKEEETENIVVEENKDAAVLNLQSKVNESTENEEEVIEQSDEEEEVSEATKTDIKENGHIITEEEKSESSTTKKVVVVQSTVEESEEEVEEEVEEEEEEEYGDVDVEEVIVLKKLPNKEKENVQIEENKENSNENSQEQEKEKEFEEKEIEKEDNECSRLPQEVENEEKESSNVEEQINEKNAEQKETEHIINKDNGSEEQCEEEVEENYEEVEDSETITEAQKKPIETIQNEVTVESQIEEENKKEDKTVSAQEAITVPVVREDEKDKREIKEETLHKTTSAREPKVSFREPSIPLEKVEDIEIKPIVPAQEIIKKSHTEIITTTTDKPSGALSTQTEYNRVENFVTVNRTTKTLDHAYEETQKPVPTLKTYFSPINDRILSTPQPVSKPHQPVYTPESQTERRHSLLLERLSVDRQVPATDIYQNNYQNHQVYEQNQWLDEPQSEVLTVSNVKPSTITKNQQWYQQTKKENYIPDTVSSTPAPPNQIWNQQNQAQSQNQLPAQPQYQIYTQQQYTPKPEYQSTYVENNAQNIYKSHNNNLQQNIYPSYTPKPSWVSSTFDSKSVFNTPTNQYSTLTKESTENYQKSTQQYNSSYVPPPWEQDSSYIAENQNYYQPPPNVSYTPALNQTWKPNPPPSKFSKPAPTAYIPPAPNQSFVKPVTPEDTSKTSGCKTYYSEYERRYISVPESTYIPNETKFPAQPDPSPQYYYDNNEPVESVEPQWRKELREFTEKSSQTSVQIENTSVRPPWEEDPKYAAPTEYTSTVTPSWTQRLRPRSWRERSYEPEYIGSKEWLKTNTLGRGRPQSSYVKSNVNSIPERTRGVSVDRYNPNNYQSPLASEHPPVQSHTLNPIIHPKTYHSPSVPAYHARASAEPREQVTAYPQHRVRAESRAPPVQSRSFKYLQWITGTED